ncbi:uncharacterized protein N7473_004969 [Penicillium subrubescens]|uniref:uncharacterized protein n=1 Tax=Penicillium subrubescens TaxID=1316194 RepID=UPI0025452486|nr:uncharacterized protein N7473_004969 [Penicillium subrubescens]KAJ5900899.1 hypothetical protein N7473_004969 [Penicillium subrubescens]
MGTSIQFSKYVGDESEGTSTVDSKQSSPNILPRSEGVAPLKDANKNDIPPTARWTKIDQLLVSPAALEAGNERYEERLGFVIVLRVLTKEEIQAYALKTEEIRGKLFQFESAAKGFNSTDNSLDLFPDACYEGYVRDKRRRREEKQRQAKDQDSAAREEKWNESRQAFVMGEEDKESLHSISIEDEASMGKRSTYGHKHPIDDPLVDVMPQEPLFYPPEYIGDDLEGTSMVNSMERSPDTLPKRAVDAIALLEHSRTNFGPEDPNTMAYMEHVVEVFWQHGRLRELKPLLNELLDLKPKQMGPGNASTLARMDTKGRMLFTSRNGAYKSLRKGDHKKGEELLLDIVEASEKHQHSLALREASELAAIDLDGAYFENGEPEKADAFKDLQVRGFSSGK